MQVSTSNPVETLAAALYAACLRDLPYVTYQDRDWQAFAAMTAHMTDDERQALTFREQDQRTLVGPTIEHRRRHTAADVYIDMFEQLWPHEGLGYRGEHVQAFTKAYTVIFTSRHFNCSAVYFGASGKLAYFVPADSRGLLREYINNRKLPSVIEAEALGWTDDLHDHPFPLLSSTHKTA